MTARGICPPPLPREVQTDLGGEGGCGAAPLKGILFLLPAVCTEKFGKSDSILPKNVRNGILVQCWGVEIGHRTENGREGGMSPP